MEKPTPIETSDLSYFGTSRPVMIAQPAVPVTPDWRRWIAENLLLNGQPASLVSAMVARGIDAAVATAEIRAAMEHPYLAAARKLGAGRGGGDAKIKKLDWILTCYRKSARLASDFGTVPRVRKPSRQEFLDRYYSQNRPVVIEGAIDDWPALTRWTSPQLKQRLGDRKVQVQANRNSDPNYERNCEKHQREMSFGEYIDTIEAAGDDNNWYMTANNSGKNTEALRELWDDIVQIPEYLRADDPQSRGFLWFGPKGTLTPLHHDLTNNLMAQVRGRKRVRLVAPHDYPYVYNDRHCFSQVDVGNIDLKRFPLFKEAALLDVTIGPGDLLLLPVGWWHYVRSLDISISMTFTNFVFDNDFHSVYQTYEEI